MEPASSLNRFWKLIITPGTLEFYLFIAIISLCLFSLFFLLRQILKRRKKRIHAPDEITDESTIRKVLQEAVDQHLRFEVQICTPNGSKFSMLCCTPYYIGIDTIILKVVGLKTLSRSWENCSLNVYFRLSQKKDSFAYFVFCSTIHSISAPADSTCLIKLPIPQRILCTRQKRSSLRILPPQRAIKGAALWYGENMPVVDTINDISRWPNPLFFFIKGKVTQFSIEDISDGGISLSFSQKLLESFNIQFSISDQFILMLDLIDGEPSELLRVWLDCKVLRVTSLSEGSRLVIGAKFNSWGKPKTSCGESSSIIEWLRISFSQEVEVLTNWTINHQIKLLHDDPE